VALRLESGRIIVSTIINALSELACVCLPETRRHYRLLKHSSFPAVIIFQRSRTTWKPPSLPGAVHHSINVPASATRFSRAASVDKPAAVAHWAAV